MNWKIFSLKYDKHEDWAFEQMSYLLFCAEFDNRIGLFRYKNQTGIETEPIKKDGILYAFQAKYYTTSVTENKADIIDSIKKAKSKNNDLKKLLFYINQELSESTTKSKKKPQYQLDIEKSAEDVGIEIQWRVRSHFELQLSLPENKYIKDLFFSLEPSEEDLLNEVITHNKNILKAIQTEIPFAEKQIKIDRSKLIEEITEASQQGLNVVISGEGGCGKTAIFKEFYNLNCKKIPICIFKATELKVNHVNDLFQFDHKFSLAQFISAYQNECTKIFVIDSAEKLAEIINLDILRALIQRLKETGWSIIFTVRYSYLNDLIFHIKENYQLSYIVNDISLIGIDVLKTLSQEFGFTLPENHNFIERLRNLFYLSEYILFYPNIDKKSDFRSFIDLLWKKKIQDNLIQKDNLHLERERSLISIVEKRCETGRFYVNADALPQAALFQLKQDEILGYDDTHNGYFITHDIYEEWTLNKIVSHNYANYLDTKQFFEELGNSLPKRRAFRLWLSDQLSDNSEEIEGFIQEAFKNSAIIQFWKDELLISVLLSEHSQSFFNFFESDIIADDFNTLKRILFLLRIACSDISKSDNFNIIKPKGKGWQEVIALVFKYKSEFFDNNYNLVLPLLTEWCNFTKEGITTRYSGLLALSIVEKDFYISNDVEENILTVVFNASREIKSKLTEIFNKVVDNKWTKHNAPYYGLCSKILAKPYIAVELIKTLPLSVIKLCDLFWRDNKTDDDSFCNHSRYGVVEKYKLDYFPASAHQTPIYWLLQHAFYETLEFIIHFTNQSVEFYRKSDYGKKEIEKITLYINDKKVTQYLSEAIWCMHRGTGNPAVPHLLQSIHMALEKILLEFSRILPKETVCNIIFTILSKSKSASLTSIVCSIVLSNPNKFHNIALLLFQTIELFRADSIKTIRETEAKTLYSISLGLGALKDKLYVEERLKSCEDKHRNQHLEALFVNYQFFGVSEFSKEQNAEFINQLYEIIDNHKNKISNKTGKEQIILGILLARVDRRTMHPKIKKQNNSHSIIELNPKLSPKLKKESELVINRNVEFCKYIPLNLWSNFTEKRISSSDTNKVCIKYNENPCKALIDTKELIKDLEKNKHFLMPMDEHIPCKVCSKLIVKFRDKLEKEDKRFCEKIIISSICQIFSDDYRYQVCDDVEAAMHAIPYLIEEFPTKVDGYLTIMILALMGKREFREGEVICNYVIKSIHSSNLWEKNAEMAQLMLLGYINFKPVYKKIIEERRKEKGHRGRISKSLIFEELEREINSFSLKDISFDVNDIDSFDIHDYEIIYQLIPSNTINKVHLNIFRKSLPFIASNLLKDRRKYKKESGDDSHIYLLRIHIFRRFAYFILQREIAAIEEFLNPFIAEFYSTEEDALFIAELIGAEDNLKSYEQFWYIWNCLYPRIKDVSSNPQNYYLKEVLINYLLAWRFWREGVEEWHSLKKENLSLFEKASKDLGNIPSVLYSVSRVINTIGSNFEEDGIDWIYTIISDNKSLVLGDLESKTLFYLEKFTRKYIYNNRETIRTKIRLKSKVIPILDFMIERGSIHGYLLRENIV